MSPLRVVSVELSARSVPERAFMSRFIKYLYRRLGRARPDWEFKPIAPISLLVR